MKNIASEVLVSREKRSYLFASICSATAALFLFYKLFQNDLYLKIMKFLWFSIVLGLLILGNIIHGYFAFKSYNSLDDQSGLKEVLEVKRSYYKSLIVNFLSPYMILIIFFLTAREYLVALVAAMLLIMMMMGCYFFDLKPTMRLKRKL